MFIGNTVTKGLQKKYDVNMATVVGYMMSIWYNSSIRRWRKLYVENCLL